MDTLVGVLLGRQTKDIAAGLGVELSTVKTHIHHLLHKLGVASRRGLRARHAAAVAAAEVRLPGYPATITPGPLTLLP